MKIQSLKLYCTKVEQLNKLSQFVDLEVLILNFDSVLTDKFYFFVDSTIRDVITNIDLPLGIKKVYICYRQMKSKTIEKMELFAFDIFTHLKIPFGCEAIVIFKRGDDKYLFYHEDYIVKCKKMDRYDISININHFNIYKINHFIVKFHLSFEQLLEIKKLIEK